MQPTEALKRILEDRKIDILEQPDIVESLLLDYCPNRKPEIHLLVSSLKERIPQRILAARAPNQTASLIGQVREQMRDNLGMQPEKADWTANAWLKVLPPQASEQQSTDKQPGTGDKEDYRSGQETADPPAPVPMQAFVPTGELRAFINKRSLRWMFHWGWFRKVEDELVERGVPRLEATKMLNEYCGKRQDAENARSRKPEPIPWKKAPVVGARVLLGIACLVAFYFIFRTGPMQLLTGAPGFMAEVFHRAMAGDVVGTLEIVGGGALAFVLFFVGLSSLKP